MKTKIVQTIITTMQEDRTVISTSSTESYVLEADSGKVLKNITTGTITSACVCVTKKSKLADYIEIDDPSKIREVEPKRSTSPGTLK